MNDLTGQRFGRLTVEAREGRDKWGSVTWRCHCDCGKEHVAGAGKLKSGKTRSCGCFALDMRIAQLERHGITTGGKPRTFIIWSGMKARCLNPRATSYPNYGGRGIAICDEWLSFENFHKWAMLHGYADDLQIDRIDNDGDYTPENCRFVTRKENSRNTRRSRFITIDGRTQTATDWIKELGVAKSTFYAALKKGEQHFINLFLKEQQPNEVAAEEEADAA